MSTLCKKETGERDGGKRKRGKEEVMQRETKKQEDGSRACKKGKRKDGKMEG